MIDRRHLISVLLPGALALMTSCDFGERLPTDDQMITEFRANRKAFERLLELSQSDDRAALDSQKAELASLMKQLHIREIDTRYGWVIFLRYASLGSEKGYSFFSDGKTNSEVIESSLDSADIHPAQTLYRSLEAGWFLYRTAPTSD
jgi:hypothetical protein